MKTYILLFLIALVWFVSAYLIGYDHGFWEGIKTIKL